MTAAVITSYNNLDILSILWYFSIYLETLAILPQIIFTINARYAGSSLVFYVGMLASYRLFHVVHWGYTIYTRQLVDSYFVVLNGTVQLIIYCGYFGWMVPLFKAPYDDLKNIDATSDVVRIPSDQVQAYSVVSNGGKKCDC